MNQHSRETLDAYYADAASWNRDRVQSMRSSSRIAWWVALGAGAVAILEGIALITLMPLKTVVPYTLMVDRTTGFVQALKPLDQAKITPDAALTQSLLVQYVLAREGFDIATLNANYRKVALLSADAARSTYLSEMQVANPASPLVAYPRSTIIDASVKSVSPLGKNTALVRFDTNRTDAGAQAKPTGSWVAVVRYRFSDAPMSVEDRFVNPLGFQVISYRRDPEALPTAEVVVRPAAAPSGAPSAQPRYYATAPSPVVTVTTK